MDGVGQRMRAAIEARGFSEGSIANRLGFHKSTFNNWLNDRSEPKFETLMRFCDIVGVDVSSILVAAPDRALNLQLTENDDTFTKINVFDVALSAGPGRIASNEAPTDQMAFRTAWLDRNGINPAHASIVKVSGESMEPSLADGGVVMIDHRDKTLPPNRKSIFAVRKDEELLIKRAERDATNTAVLLHSDNPAEPTQVLKTTELQNFEVIGRVVWSARTWPG